MCPQGHGRSVPETTVCVDVVEDRAVGGELGGAPKATMASSSDEACFCCLESPLGFGPCWAMATGRASWADPTAFAALEEADFLRRRRKNTIESSTSRRSSSKTLPMVKARGANEFDGAGLVEVVVGASFSVLACAVEYAR